MKRSLRKFIFMFAMVFAIVIVENVVTANAVVVGEILLKPEDG